MKVIHTDCDPTLAQDRSLPYTAYLIEYLQDGTTHFDIVIGRNRVEIFDHYWDQYKYDFVNMTQTEGRVNPKLWGNPPPKQEAKKKSR